MTLDTQMTLALLRASKDGVHFGLELMQDWMNPLLTEGEQDRLVGWHLGVSL